jgi:hypothetical protein
VRVAERRRRTRVAVAVIGGDQHRYPGGLRAERRRTGRLRLLHQATSGDPAGQAQPGRLGAMGERPSKKRARFPRGHPRR